MGLDEGEVWCVPSVISPVVRQGDQKFDSLLLGEADELIESPETGLSFVCTDQ